MINMPNHTADQVILIVGSTNILHNGTVITAEFNVLEDAAPGDVIFGFDEIEVSDGHAVPITDFSVNDNTNMRITVPATGISMEKEAINLTKGYKEKLVASLTPADSDSTIEWSSSDETVASVSEDGTVTAVNGGEAVITAKANGYSTSCKVHVSVPLNSISISSPDGKDLITKGQTLQLQVAFDPEDTTDDRTVNWTSSDDTIASVDQSGLVRGLSEGEAVISAQAGNHTAEFTVKVEEIKLNSISLNKDTATIHRGESEELTVIYDPENTTDDKTAIWKSSDPEIVSVDGNGKVTANAIGSAIITAQVGNFTAECIVRSDAPLKSIEPAEASVELIKGQTAVIAYTLNPTDTTDSKEVTFTSSDTSVVTVNEETGEATAIKEGKAEIKLTGANNITAVVPVTVREIHVDEIVINRQNAVVEKGETRL